MAHILVVEDDTLTAAALTLFLKDLGHEVRKAHSVREALDCVTRAPVDLLLSDLQLPDGSGEELLPYVDAPAIALSGHEAAGETGGFHVRLVKPIDLDELGATVARVLRSASARGA